MWLAARITRPGPRDVLEALDPSRRRRCAGEDPRRAARPSARAWSGRCRGAGRLLAGTRLRFARTAASSVMPPSPASAARIAATTRSTVSSNGPVVGARGRRRPRAAAARRRGCGPARRAARSWSRTISASSPAGSRPRSAIRRDARASTDASRKILRSASGSTTVPMSRPTTMIPPSAAMARWRSSSAARTSGTRATAETAPSTASACASASVASSPSSSTRRQPAGPVVAQAHPRRERHERGRRRRARRPARSAMRGHRPVDQARVHEPQPEARGGGGADGALAGRRGAVERDDDAAGGRGGHGREDSPASRSRRRGRSGLGRVSARRSAPGRGPRRP